ncbi:hypothetical protein WJX75_001467 [Coccomyxa subellipsoidea]|uniref:Expansin-like EG45 domain-containing protein n=1 Tax=Coccomyxa subellipsoidea TaxID=248742 RepID=A0ABR2YJ87_9CHLO
MAGLVTDSKAGSDSPAGSIALAAERSHSEGTPPAGQGSRQSMGGGGEPDQADEAAVEAACERMILEGVRLLQAGKLDQAEYLLLEGVKYVEASLPESTGLASLLDQQALVQFLADKLPEAEAAAARMLALAERLFADEEAAVAMCSLRLGTALAGQGRWEEAELLLEEAAEALQEAFGKDYEALGEARFYLALGEVASSTEASLPEVDGELIEGLRSMRKNVGVGPLLAGAALREHHRILDDALQLEDWSRAEALFLQEVRLHEALDAGSEGLALLLYQFSTLQFILSRLEDAHQLCQRSSTLAEKIHKPGSDQAMLRTHRLGTIAAAAQDTATAEELLLKSQQHFLRRLGKDNPITGEARFYLALTRLHVMETTLLEAEWGFMMRIGWVLTAVLACILRLTLAAKPLSDWRQGIATFYGGAPDGMDPYDYSYGTSIGSCGYGYLDKTKYPFWSVGALATSSIYYQQGPVQGCGQCFEIECLQNAGQFTGRCNQDPNARTITLMITDCCPECEPDHIDIQALTFTKMAPMAGGRVDMRYRRVQCHPPSDLHVIVDQNRGAGGWIRLQVKDAAVRGSVKLVQVKGPNTDWQSMNNVWGASWESTSVPMPPLDFRIQDDTGTEVTAFGVVKANGETGVLPTGINFQFGSTQGAPSSAPSSAATASSSATASASTSSSKEPQVSAFQGPNQPSNPDSSSSAGSSNSSGSGATSAAALLAPATPTTAGVHFQQPTTLLSGFPTTSGCGGRPPALWIPRSTTIISSLPLGAAARVTAAVLGGVPALCIPAARSRCLLWAAFPEPTASPALAGVPSTIVPRIIWQIRPSSKPCLPTASTTVLAGVATANNLGPVRDPSQSSPSAATATHDRPPAATAKQLPSTAPVPITLAAAALLDEPATCVSLMDLPASKPHPGMC